jgi:hypothetical protein
VLNALIGRHMERIKRVSPRTRKKCGELAACILGLTIGGGMGVLIMLGMG